MRRFVVLRASFPPSRTNKKKNEKKPSRPTVSLRRWPLLRRHRLLAPRPRRPSGHLPAHRITVDYLRASLHPGQPSSSDTSSSPVGKIKRFIGVERKCGRAQRRHFTQEPESLWMHGPHHPPRPTAPAAAHTFSQPPARRHSRTLPSRTTRWGYYLLAPSSHTLLLGAAMMKIVFMTVISLRTDDHRVHVTDFITNFVYNYKLYFSLLMEFQGIQQSSDSHVLMGVHARSII